MQAIRKFYGSNMLVPTYVLIVLWVILVVGFIIFTLITQKIIETAPYLFEMVEIGGILSTYKGLYKICVAQFCVLY